MKLFKYKGYEGWVDFTLGSPFYGHIANTNDLVTFESDTLDELEKQFKLAVDDYIEFCKEVGKDGI